MAVGERLPGYEVLPPFLQVRFDHHTDNSPVALRDLLANRIRDGDLPLILLVAVRVRTVDHHPFGLACRRECRRGRIDAFCVIIRRLAATQDEVAVVVAARPYDGHLAILVDREEVVPVSGGDDCGHRDIDVAIGSVLETDRR